jgi:hypothetical protein
MVLPADADRAVLRSGGDPSGRRRMDDMTDDVQHRRLTAARCDSSGAFLHAAWGRTALSSTGGPGSPWSMVDSSSAGRRGTSLRFTGKDWIATGLVAAVVVIYAVYVAAGSAWFVDTVREMALVGLVGGFLSRLIGGRDAFSPRWPAVVAAFTTLGLGILAMVTGSGALLVAFIAANVVLCVAALVVQAHTGNAPVEHRDSVEVLR